MVEDDAASLMALTGILRHWGWQVDTAASLTQAITKIDATLSHLVLDLMLPDGDGTDLLRHIHQNRLRINVIVTTGVSDPTRLQAVKQFNPKCLLMKPIRLEKLRECLG